MQETDLVILFPQHKEHLAKKGMIKQLLKEADRLQQHYSTECANGNSSALWLTYCVQHFNKFGKIVQPACVCHLVKKKTALLGICNDKLLQQIEVFSLHMLKKIEWTINSNTVALESGCNYYCK